MPDPFAYQLTQDLEPADVRHVLTVFEADLARLRESLRATAAAGEAEAFRRAAHQTAGAAGAVGAAALEAAARLAMIADTSISPGAENLDLLIEAALRTSRDFRASLA